MKRPGALADSKNKKVKKAEASAAAVVKEEPGADDQKAVEAEAPTDGKNEKRDIMKARKFTSMLTHQVLPKEIADRHAEILEAKKDGSGKHREQLTELINASFQRDETGKLVAVTDTPYFTVEHTKEHTTGIKDAKQAVIWEVAAAMCGGVVAMREAIARGACKALGDGEYPNVLFRSSELTDNRTWSSTDTTGKTTLTDQASHDEFGALVSEIMGDPDKAIVDGSMLCESGTSPFGQACMCAPPALNKK